MAYALAERELNNRNLDDQFEIVTGSTQLTDHVHPEVIEAMYEVGIDISDRLPREVTFEELQNSEYVTTMGRSAEAVCPAGWSGENRDWGLDDPDGRSPDEVAEIRAEIDQRISGLFDELSRTE